MHEITRSGRHRGAARYNPAAELSTIVKSAGQTGIKVSAVLAASGGLVAAFALPAQAATPAAVSTVSTADTTAGVQALTAAPGVQALALAPAVVAPAAAAPALTDVVGVSGVTAVAKPKPKPAPAPAVQAVSARSDQSATASRSSRSSSPARSSSTKVSSQTTAPAPSRTVPAGTSGVVNIARTLLGIAYVYGGSTPAGFDCSGLTQYVFAKAGRSIPRTASAQQRAATPVSNPQPGDLVFYGSPAWHVGIYTGNGMMIDSPRPGKFSSERKMFSGVTGYGRF